MSLRIVDMLSEMTSVDSGSSVWTSFQLMTKIACYAQTSQSSNEEGNEGSSYTALPREKVPRCGRSGY
ncbi:unnamed protein product [Toxocara canis]|uniref:Uncharacterized protein n=1 Tax=Toxocara canis TaxID=6265 RepID=A0A183VBW0_TOXCA|nr:unnamed protein product [Toxocara canis]